MVNIFDGVNVCDIHIFRIGNDGEVRRMSEMATAHTFEAGVAFAGNCDFHENSFRLVGTSV